MGEPALEPLATALGDKKRKPSIRQGAAWALGDMKSVMARDALVAALGDEDGDVRDAAADALASIGDDQSHSTADRSVGE
jgi:HEAT repeat protein